MEPPYVYVVRLRPKRRYAARAYIYLYIYTHTHTQVRQWTCKRNFEAYSPYHCCGRKKGIIANSESVSLTLFIQISMRMRRVMLSSVDCLAVPYV
jgi:hypothetical protein